MSDLGDIAVVHAPESRRFEIRVDGELAGIAEYVHKGGRYIFTHTQIDPAYEGKGLGSTLARGALDEMRRLGAPIVPLCPFIAAFIERHPEYDDLVDHDTLDHLERHR